MFENVQDLYRFSKEILNKLNQTFVLLYLENLVLQLTINIVCKLYVLLIKLCALLCTIFPSSWKEYLKQVLLSKLMWKWKRCVSNMKVVPGFEPASHKGLVRCLTNKVMRTRPD